MSRFVVIALEPTGTVNADFKGREAKEQPGRSLMARQLEGSVALVTGGAAGIGKAAVLAFAEEGASVAIADLKVDRGNELAHVIESSGSRAIFVKTDVSRIGDVEKLVRKTTGGRPCSAAATRRHPERPSPHSLPHSRPASTVSPHHHRPPPSGMGCSLVSGSRCPDQGNLAARPAHQRSTRSSVSRKVCASGESIASSVPRDRCDQRGCACANTTFRSRRRLGIALA
jgi:hypothetical protein